MDHTLASEHVASYMGTGVFIAEDRHRMVVEYVPEPVLAEAACQLLHGKRIGEGKSYTWDYGFFPEIISDYLLEFARKCLTGIVDVGGLGELLSRIVLSLSYDLLIYQALRRNI